MVRVRRTRVFLLVAALLASVGSLAPTRAHPGLTSRVSTVATGEPNGATPAETVTDTTSPEMSLDGRWVAFSSDASNLVAGDTNLVADVFLRDLQTNTITRASVGPKGAQANGASHSPSLSVDGRYLAFVTEATNLVAGDSNGRHDIVLKDLATGALQIISRNGAALGNGNSTHPFVSLFGTFVTFQSESSNLAPGDTNGLSDAFVRDVKRNRTERIAPGTISNEGDVPLDVTTWTESPQISYEGRYVSYVRGATHGSPLTPIARDIFVLDRSTRKTQQVKLPPWGNSAKVMASNPVLSANGRIVAFEAWSAVTYDDTYARRYNPPVEPIDTNDALVRNPVDHQDIYFYDRVVKAVGYVSVNSWNQATAATTSNPSEIDPSRISANADSYDPVISADGSVIAWSSDASNLVAGDTNRTRDVFIRDFRDRFCRPQPPIKKKKQPDVCQPTTSRVSLGGRATQSNGASARPSMSYNGKLVTFSSSATNMVSGDANRASDIFARDRKTETINRRPDLEPITGVRTVTGGDEIRLQLRAVDKDKDPLRYSVILGMPVGAAIDATTGLFTWKTTPINQDRPQERSYDIVFWVDDPRGASDVELAKFVVRDANQSARCHLQLDRC